MTSLSVSNHVIFCVPYGQASLLWWAAVTVSMKKKLKIYVTEALQFEFVFTLKKMVVKFDD